MNLVINTLAIESWTEAMDSSPFPVTTCKYSSLNLWSSFLTSPTKRAIILLSVSFYGLLAFAKELLRTISSEPSTQQAAVGEELENPQPKKL